MLQYYFLLLLFLLLLQNPAVSRGATSIFGSGSGNNLVTPTPSYSLDVDPTRSDYYSPSSSLSPTPTPVFESPVPTYGNNTCEVFHAGGACIDILYPFPLILTNLSRSVQTEATGTVDIIINALQQFQAPMHCLLAAVPLLCRYAFPTCDPAYIEETYQPICRRDCEIVRDFLCREPWQEMVRLINLLNFDYIDQPDCGPLNDTEGGNSPMCISTINKDFIPLPLLTGPDCYSGRGRGYQGTINVTRNGIPCQSWSASSPHQHLLRFENYTELSWDHNYCRNPGERGDGPWCFTTNESVRWEYCDVEQCRPGPTCIPHLVDVCRTQGTIGKDWIFLDASTQNEIELAEGMENVLDHVRNEANGFDSLCADILTEYLCTSNYRSCDLSHSDPRPIQPCQQFCNRTRMVCGESIKALDAFMNLLSQVKINFECGNLPVPNGGDTPECYEQSPAKLAAIQEEPSPYCYKMSDRGGSYSGNVSVTITGKTCQSWHIQTPHQHPITPLDRPQLENHNYCRNPDGRGLSPWCYTTDSNTRWEYCKVPACASHSLIYIFAGAGGGLVVLVLMLLLSLCCCCYLCDCCGRRRKETLAECAISKEKFIDEPVKFIDGFKTNGRKVDISDNPLYAVNPLSQQQQPPVEYDGIKLPEFPRDNIFYIKDLGQGHFGVVVQAEVTHNESGTERSTVAIKVMKEGATSQAKKEFFREAMLMNNFDHPNILNLLGVCIEQEPFCMIFEFMELGDLNHLLRQNSPNKWAGSNPSVNKSVNSNAGKAGFSNQQLVCLMVDIAAGLDYLAQNRFVHRDLASRNCLASRNLRVKISDFGLSQDIYSTDYFKMGDTELLPIRWMPPEAILYAKFTTQSDVWSFGVVMWEIFSFGIQPYFSMTNEEVVQHVRDGNVMSSPEGCPQELSDLMMDCWAMEPSERPTATEIFTGLQRWTPNLSVTLQNQNQTETPLDYQNMATIREYAQKGVSSDEGVAGDNGVSGQFEMSIPADEEDDDIDNGQRDYFKMGDTEQSDDTPM